MYIAQAIIRCTALLLLAMAVVLQQGCTGGGTDPLEPLPRSWSITYDNGAADILGAAPHSMSITVTVDGYDEALNAGILVPGNKIELDFGDGGGWEDVTAAMISAGNGLPRQTGQFNHTYTDPGDYLLRGQVTWWDSKVDLRPTAQDVAFILAEGGDPYITVTAPPAEPSGGDDPEQDEWEIVSFTDPRDGTTYDIIDGRVLVAFYFPLDRPAADAFIAAKDLEVYSEWWEVAGVGVLLPAGVSVLDAVVDWPEQYPTLIESVDPDAVVTADA